jgi:hypothetical protein
LIIGIPGIGDEIDGAMQHAPHPGRQFIVDPFAEAIPRLSTGSPWRACSR